MPGAKAPEAERREQILAAAYAIAARERLDGLTVRRVATEAGLSPGLVHFHFQNKEGLLLALLDRLIDELIEMEMSPEVAALDTARERLLGRIREEVAKLPSERDAVELFYDYWVVGTRHPEVRGRIADALAAYRASFRPLVEDVIAEEPSRFAGTPPEMLAAIVVSFIQGNAVQAVMAPGDVDIDDFMDTLERLVPPPAA